MFPCLNCMNFAQGDLLNAMSLLRKRLATDDPTIYTLASFVVLACRTGLAPSVPWNPSHTAEMHQCQHKSKGYLQRRAFHSCVSCPRAATPPTTPVLTAISPSNPPTVISHADSCQQSNQPLLPSTSVKNRGRHPHSYTFVFHGLFMTRKTRG
ncbi:hypothetical protein H4582DRAFT_1317201 [Lactarius indigo]|nr:hypothetical protein H4582DRAFT_1317201 [Lactarius indigo]